MIYMAYLKSAQQRYMAKWEDGSVSRDLPSAGRSKCSYLDLILGDIYGYIWPTLKVLSIWQDGTVYRDPPSAGRRKCYMSEVLKRC